MHEEKTVKELMENGPAKRNEGPVPAEEPTTQPPEETASGTIVETTPEAEPDLKMDFGPQEKGPSGIGTKAILAFIVSFLIIGSVAAGIVVLSLDLDGDDEGPEDIEPVIDLTADGQGYVGTSLDFSVTITGVDPADTTVSWSFGDGGTSSGLIADHVFTVPGTYNGTVTVTYGGKDYTKTFQVRIDAIPAGPGILPDGPVPNVTLPFEGVVGVEYLTLSRMVEDLDMVHRINITLDGTSRSFLGLSLVEVLDLAGARFDASGVKVSGERTLDTTVQRLLSVPRNGGNTTYVVFAEGGEWLGDSDLGTDLALLGEDPSGGDVIKDLELIEVSAFVLEVTGKGSATPIMLDFDDMGEFTISNYTVNDGRDTYLFTGIPFHEVLSAAGMLRNTTSVKVQAADGYTVDFDIMDVLDNPESPDPFILAFMQDGEYLNRDSGPYRLITPDADYLEDDGHNWYHQTWIKQVKRIIAVASDTPAPPLPWGSPIEGSINITWNDGYMEFTSAEVASMWGELVRTNATLVKSTGTIVNGTYVGIPLLRLIELAGAPSGYGNITLEAADGYSKWIDPMEVQLREDEEGIVTLVAITQDGEWLEQVVYGLLEAGIGYVCQRHQLPLSQGGEVHPQLGRQLTRQYLECSLISRQACLAKR